MAQVMRDQRRSVRLPTVLRARCRSLSGFVDHVVISDISANGCRIDSGALIFRPGQLVVVRPEGLEGLCGEIRWVRGHCAGIAFERAIYGPVVEFLQHRHARFQPGPALPGSIGLQVRRAA